MELTYGHTLNGDSDLEGWPIEQEPSNYFGVGFTYDFKPREVIIVPAPEELDMLNVQDQPVAPEPVQEAPVEGAAAVDPADMTDVLDRFDAFGPVTQIALLITLVILAWIFRERIRRLFPGGNGPAPRP